MTRLVFISTLKLVVVCVTVMVSTNRSPAGTPVYVGSAKAQLVSMHQIDHATWNDLLMKYVDRDGRVDYKSWHANQADLSLLDSYLKLLSSASSAPDGHTELSHKLAFWINAYNAVTIKGILREYPTTSIRNHTPKLWGYHIWHDLKLHVGRKPYSLDEMEHQVLRKMGEPRIHFAIVCASIGCPRLLNEAYVPDRIDDQLTTNAKDFFSRQQNFRYDANKERFYLSSIMKWFADDFGSDQASVLKRIANWLPGEAATSAAGQNAVSVSYLDYDWNLNSQR